MSLQAVGHGTACHVDMEQTPIRCEFHPEAGSRLLVVEDDMPLAELLASSWKRNRTS